MFKPEIKSYKTPKSFKQYATKNEKFLQCFRDGTSLRIDDEYINIFFAAAMASKICNEDHTGALAFHLNYKFVPHMTAEQASRVMGRDSYWRKDGYTNAFIDRMEACLKVADDSFKAHLVARTGFMYVYRFKGYDLCFSSMFRDETGVNWDFDPAYKAFPIDLGVEDVEGVITFDEDTGGAIHPEFFLGNDKASDIEALVSVCVEEVNGEPGWHKALFANGKAYILKIVELFGASRITGVIVTDESIYDQDLHFLTMRRPDLLNLFYTAMSSERTFVRMNKDEVDRLLSGSVDEEGEVSKTYILRARDRSAVRAYWFTELEPEDEVKRFSFYSILPLPRKAHKGDSLKDRYSEFKLDVFLKEANNE